MNREKTVLIIDDDETMRFASRTILEEAGVRVIEASDGEEGLSKALQIRPDLVLCDIEMPKKNGFEVLKMFRQNKPTATVPFVFLTGRSERNDMRKGMDLGADDFLTKPFTASELLSTVEVRLTMADRVRSETEQELDELRRSISSSVPHELRTPLTGILGFASVLKEQGGSLSVDELQNIAEHILGSGKRLEQTLEKFWQFTEIAMLARDEEARATLRMDELPGAYVVIRAAARQKAESHARKEDLSLTLSQDVCLRITDKHLTVLLEELLDNAFKFSARGSAVRVTLTAEGKHGLLIVQDSGNGMKSEEIDRIGGFMQFGRKRREQQGLGLGLSIAQELTRLFGGQLSVVSEGGHGTTVKVQLPLCGQPNKGIPTPSPVL